MKKKNNIDKAIKLEMPGITVLQFKTRLLLRLHGLDWKIIQEGLNDGRRNRTVRNRK